MSIVEKLDDILAEYGTLEAYHKALDEAHEGYLLAKRTVDSGVNIIKAERDEHFDKHGWDYETDSEYVNQELIKGAMAYLTCNFESSYVTAVSHWPFKVSHFKPNHSNPIDNLKKSGSMIAAEIDRINISRGKTIKSKSQEKREIEQAVLIQVVEDLMGATFEVIDGALRKEVVSKSSIRHIFEAYNVFIPEPENPF